MAKPLPTDLPFHSFATVDDFNAFLEINHTILAGFYLKLAKKSSGIKSVTADEAIEVGLCYGWIDGWGRSIDSNFYFKRYTPRRPKSIWSRKNVATVVRLIEAGRMSLCGLAAVKAAQNDGRWDKAYGGRDDIELPDDFTTALTTNKSAKSFFESLDSTARFSISWRLRAASPEAKANTIDRMVQLLAENRLPGSGAADNAMTRKARQPQDRSKRKRGKSMDASE